MRRKVATDLQERLATLRDTTTGLERDRSTLLRQIRGSLEELRAGRRRLIETRRAADAASPAEVLGRQAGLTPREVEVALLLADGCSNAVVARALSISPHTARHHTQHILVKLAVGSRAKAGAVIRQHLGASPLGRRTRTT